MFRLTISLNLNHIYYQVNHLNGFQLKIFMNNKKKILKLIKLLLNTLNIYKLIKLTILVNSLNY